MACYKILLLSPCLSSTPTSTKTTTISNLCRQNQACISSAHDSFKMFRCRKGNNARPSFHLDKSVWQQLIKSLILHIDQKLPQSPNTSKGCQFIYIAAGIILLTFRSNVITRILTRVSKFLLYHSGLIIPLLCYWVQSYRCYYSKLEIPKVAIKSSPLYFLRYAMEQILWLGVELEQSPSLIFRDLCHFQVTL